MNKTQIEWVKNPDGTQGYTWNPITGCRNHVNGLCNGGGFPCYAHRLAHGRLRERYLANETWAPLNYYADVDKENENHPRVNPFYPRFWPERLESPFGGKGSAGIFTCDMSDLFGIGIPPEWTEAVMNVVKIASQHRFYLLTKQPQNLLRWSPFPENCYVGVTATGSKSTLMALASLAKIEATVKFLSFEPLLESIIRLSWESNRSWLRNVLGWLIIGAQTKPNVQPKVEWVKGIIESADQAGIPVFIKHNINSEDLPDNAWGKDGWPRHEMPYKGKEILLEVVIKKRLLQEDKSNDQI